MEKKRRTLLKTFTFRILATLLTFALVYIFTGSFELAGVIGGLDFLSKLVLYYAHERAWNKIDWGMSKN